LSLAPGEYSLHVAAGRRVSPGSRITLFFSCWHDGSFQVGSQNGEEQSRSSWTGFMSLDTYSSFPSLLSSLIDLHLHWVPTRRLGGAPTTKATRVAPRLVHRSRMASRRLESVEQIDWVPCQRAAACEKSRPGRNCSNGCAVGGYQFYSASSIGTCHFFPLFSHRSPSLP
jgi:hypothetical protein